jgi:hypothetical protein
LSPGDRTGLAPLLTEMRQLPLKNVQKVSKLKTKQNAKDGSNKNVELFYSNNSKKLMKCERILPKLLKIHDTIIFRQNSYPLAACSATGRSDFTGKKFQKKFPAGLGGDREWTDR